MYRRVLAHRIAAPAVSRAVAAQKAATPARAAGLRPHPLALYAVRTQASASSAQAFLSDSVLHDEEEGYRRLRVAKAYAAELTNSVRTAAAAAAAPHAAPAAHKPALSREQLLIPELFPRATMVSLEPVKVPKDDISDSLTTLRALSVAKVGERLALVYAALESGEVDRAENLFNRCWRSNPADTIKSIDASFVNRIIETHLELHRERRDADEPAPSSKFQQYVAHEQRAIEWMHRMYDFKLAPDEVTYSLLCCHFLRVNDTDRALGVIEKYEQAGFDIKQLFECPAFSGAEDRQLLEAMLRSVNKMPESSNGLGLLDNPDLDNLMLSALKDAKALSDLRSQGQRAANLHILDIPGSQVVVDQAEIQRERAKELLATQASGVSILRKALSDIGDTSGMDKYNQQLRLEERSYMAALEMQEASLASMPQHLRSIANTPIRLLAEWDKKLLPIITEEIEKLAKSQVEGKEKPFVELLKLLAPAKITRIAISEFLRAPIASSTRSRENPEPFVRAVMLARNIGAIIEREHNLEKLNSRKTRQTIAQEFGIHRLHTTGRLMDASIRKIATEMSKRNIRLNKTWIPKWGSENLVEVGAFLMDLVIKHAKISVTKPDPLIPQSTIEEEVAAFKHEVIFENTKNLGVVVFHHALLELLTTQSVSVSPLFLPMLVQPRPWLTAHSGGYLQHSECLLRIQGNAEHQDYLRAADEANHLSIVLRAIDVLGSTAWMINSGVYKVAAVLWNSGEEVPGLPQASTPPEIPKPDDYDTNPEAAKAYRFAAMKRDRDIANSYSQRCDVNYKLEIAKFFLGETIYFPHNLDFRGRAYPLPPNLNHMSNDLCRGLLTFGKARALGPSGLRWIKIQVSNLAGNDKVSLEDREKFADEHRELIIDSAERPLEGKRWWLESENPWQLLATCIELNKAWKSPNPEEYMSALPIHQDGSCNGLQHYAALGGDYEGARVVNLVPSDRPQDVYTGVADQVRKLIEKDLAEPSPPAEALIMKDRINRKLVKQTVMTNTYGVTFVGARDQVKNRLREANQLDKESALTDEQINSCSLYITHKIFESMGSLFQGARKIQVWLNHTARVIAKSIPENEINVNQLKDSAMLSEMGLLPSSISLALQAVEEATQDINSTLGILESPGNASTPAASADADSPISLEDAVKADNAKGKAPPAMESDLLMSKDELDNSILSLDEEWDLGLAPKKTLKVNKAVPDNMTSVTWTTPLGLPVVQPYRSKGMRNVTTSLQTFKIVDDLTPTPVNAQKQSSAFPPNFVHSLDASHMMLSAIACQACNVEYAAVHDSYWTHAGTVDQMNTILREAFVRLHTENIMDRLRDELLSRYGSHKIMVKVKLTKKSDIERFGQYLVANGRAQEARKRTFIAWVDLTLADLPKRGEFDIQLVRNSQYFFH
ncbi:DNA-directed RNA polymerase [Polyrhizophydium stewartii]|uniref:DNA-directed RNA polymerase n=1 Tax=Polyrhizophydium stewartii TaxID=2732419 RepID=A0ABR4NFY0_9FUNG